LQAHGSDTWQWRHDPVQGYFVRNAYQLLTSQQTTNLDAAEELIWHIHVPLKFIFSLEDSCATGYQQRQIW
jgi:hypothetical protein